MNKKQNLFSCISGFEYNAAFKSARDDFYYDLIKVEASHKQRVDHLYAYADQYVPGGLSYAQCSEVDEALRKNMTIDNSDDRNRLYFSL